MVLVVKIGYSSIPSLKSIPKPKENVTSGPFETNSGFGNGDFKLLTSDGNVTRYLDTGDDLAVEGKIVRNVDASNLKYKKWSIT